MTACREIAPLLADVAEGTAVAWHVASVDRHVHRCTTCRIALAREGRLSAAIASIRETGVDEVFTAAVMERIPASPPKRKHDRHGLRLAAFGALLLLGASALGALSGPWRGTGLASATRPALPPDVVDFATRGLVALVQTFLMALRTLVETPLMSSAAGTAPTASWIVGTATVLALVAFGSCVLALAGAVLARTGRSSVAA